MAIPTVNGQQITPYFPIQVAAALRFINSNGDLVTQMYPTGATQAEDSPQTGYISLIGSTVGNQVNQITLIQQILNNYAITLASLQTQITTIQTSGAAMLPHVNGGCFSSGGSMAIADAVSALVASECSYITALGTPTALSLAVAAQCTGLNVLPAFSQNSAMAGLAGWKSTVLTIADAVNNLEVSYCDSRAGITKALSAVTPTCAQVIVEFQAIINDFASGFNLYFNGYTFVPTGYTDGGSQIRIVDAVGNIAVRAFNIITQSTTSGPLNISTSGTTLSSQSTYTIYVDSIVSNSSIGLTCDKTTIAGPLTIAGGPITSSAVVPISSGGGTTPNLCCPDIGNYTVSATSGVTAINLITGLSYTPRFVTLIPKNSFTGGSGSLQAAYMTYTLGGAILTFPTLGSFGTINFDWIAYR